MTAPAPSCSDDDCRAAIAAVPRGRWGVGVSGGADSVALLLLLCDRPDLSPHVIHLDHETRAAASTDDARFVGDLAARLELPCTIERRSAVEPAIRAVPRNPSARYRAARLALFRHTVQAHGLAGVILAHHADDQAETVFHRLLRGSGPAGLAGMSPRACVGGGLTILRPLLEVSGGALRAVLVARGQAWREDASNASDAYLRNRLRRTLATRPALRDALLRVAASCGRWRGWVNANAPMPAAAAAAAALPTSTLAALPAPLRRELARRWLASAGVPAGRIEPDVVRQLIRMADDAATPARQHFPGEVLVRRSRGALTAQPRRTAGADQPGAQRRGTSGAPDPVGDGRPSRD